MTTSLDAAHKGTDVSLPSSLTATNTSGTPESVRGTTSNTSGKWYFEGLIVAKSSAPFIAVGVCDSGFSVSSYLLNSDISGAYYDGGSGGIGTRNGGTGAFSATDLSVSNLVGIAIDFDTNPGDPVIYFARNNVWQNSADPTTGAGALHFATSNALFPALSVSGDGSAADTITINLGATALTYTPPSGYSSWDTLVTATIYPRIIMF